jgi:hypothetical protein
MYGYKNNKWKKISKGIRSEAINKKRKEEGSKAICLQSKCDRSVFSLPSETATAHFDSAFMLAFYC